jgi:hypothetical protein
MASKRKQHNVRYSREETLMTAFFSSSRKTSVLLMCLAFLTTTLVAEECRMGSEIDQGTRSSLEAAAQRYYQAMATGNSATLQQNSIPDVASNFGGIQGVINDNKDNLGTSAKVRDVYQLEAPGNAPIARAEFYCGIMNSSNYVAFAIPSLPPGSYGMVMLDPQGGKNPVTVSFILQRSGTDWRIGGVYIRPTAIAGHDSQWYVSQAQQFKAKGQTHNAWYYYLTAWDLSAPVNFMGNVKLDKLVDEMQPVRPADLPSAQKPVSVAFGGKTYNVTHIFPVPVSEGLGLVVKYQVPDVSNTTVAFNDNISVMKGLVAKYPEFREGFSSIVARAVAPSGQDYGTLLAIKDIK